MIRRDEAWLTDHMSRAKTGFQPDKHPKPKKITCPSEHEEQKALFYWASVMLHRYPELKLLHAIPNGGLRNKVVAAKLKAEGVKPGVPDVCLPIPRGGFHGLYIEMKIIKGYKISDDQDWWAVKLRDQGYKARLCRGCKEAIEVIEKYLDNK